MVASLLGCEGQNGEAQSRAVRSRDPSRRRTSAREIRPGDKAIDERRWLAWMSERS